MSGFGYGALEIRAACVYTWPVNIAYNWRHIRWALVPMTVLCWLLPGFLDFSYVWQNLFGHRMGLSWDWLSLLVFNLFFGGLWLFYFLKAKFEYGTRLTEVGIVQPSWRGSIVMPWENVRAVEVNLHPYDNARSLRRTLAFYFTDQNGGVLIVPVKLFLDQEQAIREIERRLSRKVRQIWQIKKG